MLSAVFIGAIVQEKASRTNPLHLGMDRATPPPTFGNQAS
jgi:hypothetical protein